MTISELVTALKGKITPETYQQHKKALDELEWTIAVENMAAANNQMEQGNG